MMNPDPITFALDERNLAHVLAALALAGIADSLDSSNLNSRCWWAEDSFNFQLTQTKEQLLDEAYDFVKSIAWIDGIGSNEKHEIKASPHHGLFTAKTGHCGNPLLSYHDQGITSSVFKTFAGQLTPVTPLTRQLNSLHAPTDNIDWLFQRGLPGKGAASWKFDCRVAGHAYDQGFGSNEDKSGDRDPFYPAIELLSIAGAAFFAGPQAWLLEKEQLAYCIWQRPIPVHLASLAATIVPPAHKRDQAKSRKQTTRDEIKSLLDGIDCRFYRVAPRDNSYGQGRYYKHFPEASLTTQPITK